MDEQHLPAAYGHDESLPPNLGRRVKYTPERLAQISKLVERGRTRDEIAEIIGVSVGSLQVTCSRCGISLRRQPTLDNGVGLLPRKRRAIASAAGNGDGDASNDKVTPDDFAGNGEPLGITITLRYRGRTRTVPLAFDHATLVEIVLESQLRGVALGELIATLLQQAIKLPPA